MGIKDTTFRDTTNTRVLNCFGFICSSLEGGVCCLEMQAAQKAPVERNRPLCLRWYALPRLDGVKDGVDGEGPECTEV